MEFNASLTPKAGAPLLEIISPGHGGLDPGMLDIFTVEDPSTPLPTNSMQLLDDVPAQNTPMYALMQSTDSIT